MFRSLAEATPEEMVATQEWLRRALANSRTARLIVEQGAPELLVEAVTQVQQACEKATKAILLGNGMTYREVTAMGHNTIGAFVNLIARMLERSPLAEDFSRALLKGEATESANALAKLVLRNYLKTIFGLDGALRQAQGERNAILARSWGACRTTF